MKRVRVGVGLAFWSGLAAVLWVSMADRGKTAPADQPAVQIWHYYTGDRKLELQLPPESALSPGDPVFIADSQGMLTQVGIVLDARGGQAAEAALFPSAPTFGELHAYYLSNPDSIRWVVQTLLPPQRRQEIEAEMSAALQEHRQELLQAIRPVVEHGVRDAFAVLKDDLPRAVADHRPQIEALAARYESEILKDKLVPLVKQEVWPIVRRDSEPLARQIGVELWDRVSVWSFVWRGTLDKLPLVRGRDRVEMELQRFVDEEALPILQRHEADYQAVITRIVRDAANNPSVQAGFRSSFSQVASDPQLRQLISDIVQQAVVSNPRFWAAVRQNLTSPEAQEALRVAGDRFEPTIRHIGDLVLGTREHGLTSEFNRVLRQQVLLKDRQAIIIGDLPRLDPPLPCTPIQARFSDTAP